MHTLRSLFQSGPLLCLLAAGCSPQDLPELESAQGRPYDVMQQRVQSEYGDRFEDHLATQLGYRWPVRRWHKPPPDMHEGDWNYSIGGSISAGVAIYNQAYVTGSGAATCNDRLFAASTTNTTFNLYAFDNLFQTPPGTTQTCTRFTDALCTTTNGGWCPHRIWRLQLTGGVTRGALTFSVDGKTLYAATDQGFLYAINGATGAVNWTFSAQTDTGSANATFTGSAPWANYTDGTIYIAANYSLTVGGVTTTHVRLYKLDPTTGNAKYSFDQPGDGIVSSVIAYDAVYFGSSTGKVYKIKDSGTAFTAAGNPWPLQLWAETTTGTGNPRGVKPDTNTNNLHLAIYGTPTLDSTNNLLFLAVNNVFYSINIGTGTINSIEGGWQNGTEAQANDVPEYSSPWADPSLMTVVLGHGKDQSDTGGEQGPRCHRRDYSAAGVFNTTTLTSAATIDTNGALDNPHSSPLVLHNADSSVYVFIGDHGGNLNRWTYTTDFTNQQHFSTGHASSIESPIMIDYMAGNIYFGDDTGRVYQISQSSLQ
jgi:PQQ-like domain